MTGESRDKREANNMGGGRGGAGPRHVCVHLEQGNPGHLLIIRNCGFLTCGPPSFTILFVHLYVLNYFICSSVNVAPPTFFFRVSKRVLYDLRSPETVVTAQKVCRTVRRLFLHHFFPLRTLAASWSSHS